MANDNIKKLGWIPQNVKKIDGKKYRLWDALDVRNVRHASAVEIMTLPNLKMSYDSVRTIIRGNTMAIYVWKRDEGLR